MYIWHMKEKNKIRQSYKYIHKNIYENKNKYKNCSFEYFSKIKLTMTVLLLDMASVQNIFVLISHRGCRRGWSGVCGGCITKHCCPCPKTRMGNASPLMCIWNDVKSSQVNAEDFCLWPVYHLDGVLCTPCRLISSLSFSMGFIII